MDRVDYRHPPIHMIESKDYGSAGIDSDSVDMSLLSRISVALSFGAITGNSILKVYAGATAGAKTTALAFNYRFAGADYKAAGADILGDDTAVAAAGLTLTATTFDHRHIVVDVEADVMPAGKKWLTFEVDATATVMLLSSIGHGSPRYGGRTPATVI